MQKVFCCLLFSLLLPWVLSAQYNRILNNPDVIWAAEIDVTYALQPPQPADSLQRNDIVFWKNYDPHDEVPYTGGELLIQKILGTARSGNWPAWQFADTARLLSRAEVIARLDERDTIEVVDVATGLRSLKVVTNEVDPGSFFGVRAKQLLYFDQKKGDFELYTSAIGPVRTITTEVLVNAGKWEEIPLYDYVPFWLKMPEFSRKTAKKLRKVNDPDISWAAQIKTLDNSPEPETLHTFKNFKPPVMKVLLDRFHFDRGYAVQNSIGEPIPLPERNRLLSSIDTVVTFDPETYEEKIQIIPELIVAENVQRLRLIENWYWDDRRHQLVIQLQGYAPMLGNFDDEGNYRFDSPLFYRRKN